MNEQHNKTSGHPQILVFGHWTIVSGGIIQKEGDINILFTHSSL